jgi:uncharacterized protein (TIGR02145 family)
MGGVGNEVSFVDVPFPSRAFYMTHRYGTGANARCWTVENSTEAVFATPFATEYPGESANSENYNTNTYYYDYQNAQYACPYRFHLPTFEEWVNMWNIVSSYSTPYEEKKWWTDASYGAFAGDYNANPQRDEHYEEIPGTEVGWVGWGTSESQGAYWYIRNYYLTPYEENFRYPVRCVMNTYTDHYY